MSTKTVRGRLGVLARYGVLVRRKIVRKMETNSFTNLGRFLMGELWKVNLFARSKFSETSKLFKLINRFKLSKVSKFFGFANRDNLYPYGFKDVTLQSRKHSLKFVPKRRHRVRELLLSERGDVPGWVLVVLMTTGLVTAIWAVAAPRLNTILRNSLDSMTNIR